MQGTARDEAEIIQQGKKKIRNKRDKGESTPNMTPKKPPPPSADTLRHAPTAGVTGWISRTHTDTYVAIDPTLLGAAGEGADMAGRSAVITGASRGFGRAAALSFARAGCSRIAVAARAFHGDAAAAVRERTLAERDVREAARLAGRPDPQVVLVVGVDVADEDEVRAFGEFFFSFFSLSFIIPTQVLHTPLYARVV